MGRQEGAAGVEERGREQERAKAGEQAGRLWGPYVEVRATLIVVVRVGRGGLCLLEVCAAVEEAVQLLLERVRR